MLTVYEKMVEPSLGKSWSRRETKTNGNKHISVMSCGFCSFILERQIQLCAIFMYSSPLEIYITCHSQILNAREDPRSKNWVNNHDTYLGVYGRHVYSMCVCVCIELVCSFPEIKCL